MPKGPCYQCGEEGHFAKDCPQVVFAAELGTAPDGRPPWCGQCDQRTRMTDDPEADVVARCPRCSPPADLPAQFRYCRCGEIVRRWDTGECGRHEPVRPATSTGG